MQRAGEQRRQRRCGNGIQPKQLLLNCLIKCSVAEAKVSRKERQSGEASASAAAAAPSLLHSSGRLQRGSVPMLLWPTSANTQRLAPFVSASFPSSLTRSLHTNCVAYFTVCLSQCLFFPPSVCQTVFGGGSCCCCRYCRRVYFGNFCLGAASDNVCWNVSKVNAGKKT